MAKATVSLSVVLEKLLAELGERIKLARQRRRMRTVPFSERIGVSRETLSRMEKGDPTIAIGTYMKALYVLGLEEDIALLAKDDVLGRKLQDANLGKVKVVRVQRKPKSGLQKAIEDNIEARGNMNRVILKELLKGRGGQNG